MLWTMSWVIARLDRNRLNACDSPSWFKTPRHPAEAWYPFLAGSPAGPTPCPIPRPIYTLHTSARFPPDRSPRARGSRPLSPMGRKLGRGPWGR